MPVNSRHELLRFPQSYAFLIGIDHYPKLNADLSSAVRDARAVARVLKQRQGFDHVELVIEPLPGEDREAVRSALGGVSVHFGATGGALRDLLARIQDPDQEPHIQPQDCIVFYYAGHGKPGAFGEGPAGYLLPSDARPEKAMLKNDSLLPMEDVFTTLQKLDCHHTLLILDCCFAGKFRLVNQNTRDAGWVTDLPMYPERFERFARERAWQVLVSSGPHQTAADWVGERAEIGAERHSPFAAALIEALDGKVRIDQRIHDRRRGDGVLTAQELFLHLWDRVERLTNDGNFDQDIQYPDLFPMGNHQGGQFIFFDPDNKLNLPERKLRNPYRGLQPYEPEHSDLFFGREDVVRNLLQKIERTDLLVISAPSGSGKSSLVRAGLFPRLLKWTDDSGRQPWSGAELLVLRPGAKPWSGSPAYDRPEEPRKLLYYTGLAELLPQLKADRPQILLIDQYEQLFTEGAAPAEIDTFETELANLTAKASGQRLKILITLRSDYEWQLEESAFGAGLLQQLKRTDFLYRVPPMGLDDLHRALLLPAQAELFDFETEELPQRILAEIGYAPGALPLLSFTMSQLYEITDKDTRVFTGLDYEKLGGVNAALSTYADGIYATIGAKGVAYQDAMRKLFLRMVKVTDSGYDRRRVYTKPGPRFAGPAADTFLNEFDYADQKDAVVQEVIDLLVERQLFFRDADFVGTYLEPIHTALIQHWGQGKQWIADFGAEQLNLQRELWRAVLDSKRMAAAPSFGNDFYAAGADDGVERDATLTEDFSQLWESNAKLITVIRHITAAAKDYLLTDKDTIIAVALPHIDPEDHDKFIAFWDDCYDKAVVPDLNSLVLSGYSDQLLQLCLDNGDHWLNQAESQFVRQSWDKRIADILELKQQRNEAIAAQRKIQRKNEQIVAAIETANTSGQRLKQQILAGNLELDAKDIHGQLVLTSIVLDNAREREGEQKTSIRRGDYDGDLPQAYLATYLQTMHAEMSPDLQRLGQLRMSSEWIDLVPFESAPNAITYLQFFLCQAGLLSMENMTKIQGWGIYGYETLAALRLFQEYERTVHGNTDIGVPNGVVGAATWQAVLRWSEAGLRFHYGAEIAEPSEEFKNWLAFIANFKKFTQRSPGPAIRATEAFATESDTRKVYQWNDHPNDTHVIGIRRNADHTAVSRPNDDLFFLLVNGRVFKFWGSTDPNPKMARHRPDEAYLAPGQHQYRLGWHKRMDPRKVYRSLLPATNGVLVFRDRDNDDALTGVDVARGLDPQPNITIPFHWSGAGRLNFSAGSQVIAGGSYGTPEGEVVDCRAFAATSPGRVDESHTHAAYNVFMDLITTSCPAGQYIFYTLIDEQELTLPPRIFPADYVAQWLDRLREVDAS